MLLSPAGNSALHSCYPVFIPSHQREKKSQRQQQLTGNSNVIRKWTVTATIWIPKVKKEESDIHSKSAHWPTNHQVLHGSETMKKMASGPATCIFFPLPSQKWESLTSTPPPLRWCGWCRITTWACPHSSGLHPLWPLQEYYLCPGSLLHASDHHLCAWEGVTSSGGCSCTKPSRCVQNCKAN